MPATATSPITTTHLKDLRSASVNAQLSSRSRSGSGAGGSVSATGRRRTSSLRQQSVGVRLAKALTRSRRDSERAGMNENSHRASCDSAASLDSATRERRASRTIRKMGGALKRQMESFKSSVKSLMTTALVVVISSGVLGAAWHILLANILVEHTQLGRAYNLVAPPMIGSVHMHTRKRTRTEHARAPHPFSRAAHTHAHLRPARHAATRQ